MEKSLKNYLVVSSMWRGLSAKGWQCEFHQNSLNKNILRDVCFIDHHSVSVKVKGEGFQSEHGSLTTTETGAKSRWEFRVLLHLAPNYCCVFSLLRTLFIALHFLFLAWKTLLPKLKLLHQTIYTHVWNKWSQQWPNSLDLDLNIFAAFSCLILIPLATFPVLLSFSASSYFSGFSSLILKPSVIP